MRPQEDEVGLEAPSAQVLSQELPVDDPSWALTLALRRYGEGTSS